MVIEQLGNSGHGTVGLGGYTVVVIMSAAVILVILVTMPFRPPLRECWIPVPFPAPAGSGPNFLRVRGRHERPNLSPKGDSSPRLGLAHLLYKLFR
jgi:hypothetical protein